MLASTEQCGIFFSYFYLNYLKYIRFGFAQLPNPVNQIFSIFTCPHVPKSEKHSYKHDKQTQFQTVLNTNYQYVGKDIKFMNSFIKSNKIKFYKCTKHMMQIFV